MKGVTFLTPDHPGVSELSEDEEKWIKKLQSVLSACPKRLAIVTIGDPRLTIVDATVSSELYDEGNSESNGVALANIAGGPQVHGTCG